VARRDRACAGGLVMQVQMRVRHRLVEMRVTGTLLLDCLRPSLANMEPTSP
jgi:hypothetical protein